MQKVSLEQQLKLQHGIVTVSYEKFVQLLKESSFQRNHLSKTLFLDFYIEFIIPVLINQNI